MTKLKASAVVMAVLRRALNPRHFGQALRLHARRREKGRYRGDEQLKLYGEILPGDFLNFGYFDDPAIAPEDMSVNDFVRAQARYAAQLLGHAGDRNAPVLDVGCGMGGMSRMLLERGYQPVALTPNDLQADYVRAKYPSVPVLHCKFEDMDGPAYAGRFGTVFTAESLQYLKLPRALPRMNEVLAPGGKWVACDYFRTDAADAATDGRKRAGHRWSEFGRALADAGWKITYEQDITQNVLPTLRCVHMWGTRVGLPLLQFGGLKLRRKQPGLHYLLEDALSLVQRAADENLDSVDPAKFAHDRRYMLLVIHRAAE